MGLHASIVLKHLGVCSAEDVDELVSMFWCEHGEEELLRVDLGDTLRVLEEFKREQNSKRSRPVTPSTQASTPTAGSNVPSPRTTLTSGNGTTTAAKIEEADEHELLTQAIRHRLGGASIRRIQALR